MDINMLFPDANDETFTNIVNKLKPKESGIHSFVSHDNVSEVYATFQKNYPDKIIRLENDAVNYFYDLISLTQEERQRFIGYC